MVLDLKQFKHGGPYNAKLVIEDDVSIEQFAHIIAADELIIGKGTVISSFVYISDCSHGYNINDKIMNQPLNVSHTQIGERCFIGIHSSIMPGVKLGNNVVVGANSVVTHDVSDYHMVVGTPARAIMRYSMSRGQWVRIEE